MADSDEIFLAVEGGLDGIAVRVAEVLNVRGKRDESGEWGFVGQARTADAPYGVTLGPNCLAPEVGVVQAMDGYPVMVDVQFRTHKLLQAAEARSVFAVIVGAMPEVPTLLVHNGEWLVAAYVPGRAVEYFGPRLTPDVEDMEIWGPWVAGGRGN